MESNSKTAYRQLYEQCTAPDLYNAPWWLDATCGSGAWDAWIHYDASGLPVAALPYGRTRIRGMSALITPPCTQWVSLLKRPDCAGQLPENPIAGLPVTSIQDLSVRPDATALMTAPRGTTFTVKYSYIIPAEKTTDNRRSGYNEGLKRNIRQAEQEYQLRDSTDIEEFLALCRLSYKAQQLHPPSWQNRVIPEIVKELWARNCGHISVAESNGKVIAAILIGWDQATAYYLAGGRMAGEQGASAHALLLDQAVRSAGEQGRAFDFEGSMQAGIANFFQSFGAIPSGYWNFRRYRGMGRIWALLK